MEIECPICKGEGCEECAHGFFTVPGCAQKFVRPLLPALRLADLFAKGFLPVAGGLLDQSASFIDFAAQLEHEDRLVKHND